MISRIRGEQIRDAVLKNQHIASDAAIHESKLDINWAQHYQDALITKKVVDFVQVNGMDVSGLSEVDLSGGATPIIPNTDPSVSSDPLTGEGVIVDAPKNRAPIRNAVTGDPVLDENGREVYGRVEFVASPDGGTTPAKFVLKFFVFDPTANGGAGAEVPHTMDAGMKIDWQYAKRFNLDTVSEMFAANEKFVEGAADATAHLNIDQLAKDIYGAGFSLDRDGNANLSKSLVQQIADEITARQAADQAIRDDLASTSAGKGASLIGIEDAAGNYTATNLEGALAEIDGRLKSVEQTGGQEVADARSSSITGEHATLDERLEAGEARSEAVKTEVEAARGSDADLKARLDRMEQELADEAQARVDADTQHAADLASTEAGKGASLIGVQDADGKISATTVEGALVELADRATAVEGRTTDLETELEAARKSTALTGTEVEHADLDARLEASEAVIKMTNDEVIAARGSEASLDARLDRALNEDGTLKAGKQIHDHYKAYYQATGGETSIALSSFNIANLPAFQVGDDSLDVYVNGILQNEGLHYEEGADGLSINFDVAGDGTTLVAGDIVTIKYHINNAE